MKRKKLLSCLLTCVVLMGFASAPVQAVEVSDHVRLSQLEYESVDRYETWRDQAITRVTENVNVTIGADGIVASEDRFLLDAGETVEISCTYSPAFAEVRFGLLDGTERTQKEVADIIGISQSYISRLEKRIIKRLKKELERLL